MKRSILALWLTLALVLGPAAARGARADSPSVSPPRHYYLALGDSLAFGFQEGKFLAEVAAGTYNPATFNTGYVDDFARMLAALRPHIETVNYSCPGETTATFISGGCVFHTGDPAHHTPGLALHNDYPASVSQLDAALAFLNAHRGRVSPITINLGNNDLQAIAGACAGAPNCIATGLGGVAANYTKILDALRAAAPSSKIIVVNSADPYRFARPETVPLFAALNSIIAGVALAHDAALADIFTPTLAYDQATFCTLTFVCTPPLYDIHPTDAGYALIAQYVWAASGYAALLHDQDEIGSQSDREGPDNQDG